LFVFFLKKPAEKVDDDIDLFGSDDEEQNEETKKRLADYAAKKSKSNSLISKE
jgi:elongation factor 1-beta